MESLEDILGALEAMGAEVKQTNHDNGDVTYTVVFKADNEEDEEV